MFNDTEERPWSLDNVHLQWFAEDDPKTTPDSTEPPAGDQTGAGDSTGKTIPIAESPDQGSTPEAKAEGTISREEYDKQAKELDHIRSVHAEMKAKEQKKREEEQKKRGEFEGLYTEAKQKLETVEPEREKFKTAVDGYLQAELDALPEDFDRSLVPDGDPVQKLEWIQKARKSGWLAPKQAGDPTVPFGDTQAGGNWDGLYSKTTPA